MKNNIFLLIIASFLVLGCTKEEAAKTNTELLTNGSQKVWIIKSITSDPAYPLGNGIFVTDVFAKNPACFNDDLHVYKADKTYALEEGLTKCVATDPQVWDTGTWVFSSTESILSRKSGQGHRDYEYEIISLTADKWIYSRIDTQNGVNYKLTFTLIPN